MCPHAAKRAKTSADTSTYPLGGQFRGSVSSIRHNAGCGFFKNSSFFRSLLGQAGSELLQEQPNLDFALVAVARTHRLPRDAPLILFVLGRTAGWIGHMVEQYAIDELIRPRARYTGPAPVSAEMAY